MQIKIQFTTDKPAFDESPEIEVDQILCTVGRQLRNGLLIEDSWFELLDHNGHCVGECIILRSPE